MQRVGFILPLKKINIYIYFIHIHISYGIFGLKMCYYRTLLSYIFHGTWVIYIYIYICFLVNIYQIIECYLHGL